MICDFCVKTYFSDPHWVPHRPKPHHPSLTSWITSIHHPCTICTLLLEKLRSALIDASERDFDDQDSRVGYIPYWKILVEFLERMRWKLEGCMPLFEARILDGGARNVWELRFEGVKGGEKMAREVRGQVPGQKFNVYATYYDGQKGAVIPRIAENSGDLKTFDQIRMWMEECKKHPECGHLQTPGNFMPTRVIEVGTSDADVRLVETKSWKQKELYMTLSHCWGLPNPTIVTLRSNIDKHRERLPYDELALTFRHAITITRNLGIKYVWIDSLCIIQKDGEEWATEGPTMETVYGNSFLNIAVVSSYNSRQGIFRDRHPDAPSPSIVKVRWAGQSADCYVMRDDFWEGELLNEPLYTRGWVFQERMLSPRILHYQKRQVWWQCLGKTCCEAVPGGLSRVVDDERREELRWRQILHKDRKGLAPDERELRDLNIIWRLAAKSYKTCNLTMEKDKLMALASIAAAVQKFLKTRYVAGMWGEGDFLIDQFAWSMQEWGKGGEKPAWARLKEDEYTAPSWSWMCLDGVVKVPTLVQHGEERVYTLKIKDEGNAPTLKLQDAKIETGVLQSASITVKGELFRLTFVAKGRSEKEWKWETASKEEGDRSQSSLYLDQPLDKFTKEGLSQPKDANASRDEVSEGAEVEVTSDRKGESTRLTCCVLMLFYDKPPETYNLSGYNGYALALQSKGDTFSRIGLFHFKNFSDENWELLQERRADVDGRRYQGTSKEIKRGEGGPHEQVTLI